MTGSAHRMGLAVSQHKTALDTSKVEQILGLDKQSPCVLPRLKTLLCGTVAQVYCSPQNHTRAVTLHRQ